MARLAIDRLESIPASTDKACWLETDQYGHLRLWVNGKNPLYIDAFTNKVQLVAEGESATGIARNSTNNPIVTAADGTDLNP